MKTKRFLFLLIFSFLVSIPVASADDYGKACGGYISGTFKNATCVRSGMCSGDIVGTAYITGETKCTDAPQGTSYVCCADKSSSQTDFSNSQYYGKSCSGSVSGSVKSGTCTRNDICREQRKISGSTDCGNSSLGGVCCASSDLSSGGNTTSSPSDPGTGGFGSQPQDSSVPPAGFTNIGGIALPSETGLSEAPLESIIMSLLSWLLAMIGFIGLLAFLVSGAQYLLSYGDDDMIERAKETMKWSIVGLAVAFSGFIVVRAIAALLSGAPFSLI